jgi:hypothetical protein
MGLFAAAGNFPTALPRFYLFMLLTVLLYALFYKTRWWKWCGLGFLFFGFFAGAVTDQFRHMKSIEEVPNALKVDMQNYLVAGHFDGFEINTYVIDYVNEKGFEMGRQVSGVVGFWVPRIFWPNKPNPTGVLLGSSFIGIMESTRNTNLSCPLLAEAYIDFGVFGVIIYGLLAGMVIGWVDRIIPLCAKSGEGAGGFNHIIFSLLVLPVIVGMMLFIMRGSLMPAAAYTMGSFLSAFCLFWVFTRRDLNRGE